MIELVRPRPDAQISVVWKDGIATWRLGNGRLISTIYDDIKRLRDRVVDVADLLDDSSNPLTGIIL